jgi:hypothetical protein
MVNFGVYKNVLFYYCLLSLCIVTCKMYLVLPIYFMYRYFVSNNGWLPKFG